MFWWLKFAVGVVGAVALGGLVSWLLCVPWQKWAAVFLQLLGLAAVVHGIIRTRYSVTISGIVWRMFRRLWGKRKAHITGRADLRAGAAGVLGHGTVTGAAPSPLEQRVSALENQFGQLQREAKHWRTRADDLETTHREMLRRLREEVFEKHPQEVMGIGWAAVGILLSGF